MATPRIVGVIQARMASTRLPGKVLASTGAGTVLELMLKRVRRSRTVGHWIVATTEREQDDSIAELCRRLGVEVFRGAEDDVLDRYYEVARLAAADIIVRVTADCPLLDPRLIDRCVNQLRQGRHDYVATTVPPPSTFPDGMDVEVMSAATLKTAWSYARLPSEREHVTFYIWKQPQLFDVMRVDGDRDLSCRRLTVDHAEDLEVIRAIVEAFGERVVTIGLSAIVDWLDAHPEIARLNSMYSFGDGWQSALEKDVATTRLGADNAPPGERTNTCCGGSAPGVDHDHNN